MLICKRLLIFPSSICFAIHKFFIFIALCGCHRIQVVGIWVNLWRSLWQLVESCCMVSIIIPRVWFWHIVKYNRISSNRISQNLLLGLRETLCWSHLSNCMIWDPLILSTFPFQICQHLLMPSEGSAGRAHH